MRRLLWRFHDGCSQSPHGGKASSIQAHLGPAYPASSRAAHIDCAVVDTLGLLWLLVVHPAHIQDRDSAKLLLARLAFCLFRWRLLWADGAYAGALEQWVAALRVPRPGWCPLRLEIVRRCDGAKGWQLLPKRWIVERTFGWLARSRRLARDYDLKPVPSCLWRQ